MRKTIEYLGILQIGVNYMFQKQSVGNRHDGSTIQPGILLRTLGRSGEEEYWSVEIQFSSFSKQTCL